MRKLQGDAKKYSVSLSGATRARLRAYCELHGTSGSAVVERLINDHLDAQPENLLDFEAPVKPAPTEVSVAREMYRIAHRRGGAP